MNSTWRDGNHGKHYLVLLLSIALLLLPGPVSAGDGDNFDEIPINVNVKQVGILEVPALIQNQDAYLPVNKLFHFLKIRIDASADFNTAKGFLINPKAEFSIENLNNRILFQGKVFNLKAGSIICRENDLYLKSDLFGQIFGLNCIFNFRTLTVVLNTAMELPAIREMKLEKMRKNLNTLKGEKEADTTVNRKFSVFNTGVADWSVTNTQDNIRNNNTRATLLLGGMVAGGETTISLNYDSDRPFKQKDQYYRWRYVNNEHTLLKQVTAGRIYPQSISSLLTPVNGIQISNTPTTYRRSFGTYRINRTTEPGWIAELYVNSVLVDYVKADASGFYGFDVPLVYGTSAIQIRLYGEFGEERLLEENISIPFNFLPSGEVEYNLSTGVLTDAERSIYSRAVINYGLNKRLTTGMGAEYLSSVNDGVPIPFVNSSLRLSSSLILSGEYSHAVRAAGLLNYQLPGGMQADISYTRYRKEQTAIIYNYLEERKFMLSVPLRGKKFNAYSRFSLNQYILPKSKITNAEFMISAAVAGISTNLSTSALYSSMGIPYLFSDLSLTLRFPAAIRFTPRVQYQYKQKNVSIMKAELEKGIGRSGTLNAIFERNRLLQLNSFSLSFRLNLSFAQTAFSVMHNRQVTSMVQSVRGGMIYNEGSSQLRLNRESNAGRGGIVVLPFLDLNGNGKRDYNEPKASGLKLKNNNSRINYNSKDTTISIGGLEAYSNFLLELDKNSFDHISWQLKHKSYRITVEPNHYQLVEIPVTVAGEVSGYIQQTGMAGSGGLGEMKILIYNSRSILAGTTMTETDGYFSFLGLQPGDYIAKPDPAQLKKLQLKAAVNAIPFKIRLNKEGDIASGVDFKVEKD